MSAMTKSERLRATIRGEQVDRVPVALWRHFPGDDQRPESLAAATLAFQHAYDFDLVKVTPASSFCLRDWGAQDVWMGNMEGTREYTVHPIQNAHDWLKLSPLDPAAGALAVQLRCLQLVSADLGDEVPFIQTVFSPLAQAKNLVGSEQLLVHARRNPNELHVGLTIITQSTIRFVEEACRVGIAGLFYAVQHAQYSLLSEEEYTVFGRAYDLQVLAAAQSLWMNVLHLHGTGVMFDLLADYPVQVINWHDRETGPALNEAQGRFRGAVCGGLERWGVVVRGTPEQVRAQAVEAMEQTGGKRFVLGTGCVTPIVAPSVNLHAARRAVEGR